MGYTYGSDACAALLHGPLREVVEGSDALDVSAVVEQGRRKLRNFGVPGVGSMALSAMDVALWDLKARLLDLPLVELWGRYRESVPVYGSGGFTSYPIDRLQAQLGGWVEKGIRWVKMKVGSEPSEDLSRVYAARQAIGNAELFVDANGAYERKEALALASHFAAHGVTWFEEPVSSDDREGLRLLRDRAPPGMRIAAGEYAYGERSFLDLLLPGCVDVLQADVTRCGGFSGLFAASALASAFHVPLSAHTSPSLHAAVGASLRNLENIEYFHDHARIEGLLFDGVPSLVSGRLVPRDDRPGHGLELKRQDAASFLV